MRPYDDEKPPLEFHLVARTNRLSENESEETGFYAHEEGVGFIPRKMWPDAIKQACFDTWLDEIDYPLREEQTKTFIRHAGLTIRGLTVFQALIMYNIKCTYRKAGKQ